MKTLDNQKYLVSIICPVHNCEKYIDKTLDSICNQTYSNLEIIIVDDCSTDRTVEIIKKRNDGRIKLFLNSQNQGAAFSRNVALNNTNGDYIAFLDGDDLWSTNKIEKQINFMLKNNFDFSYTEYFIINESGILSNIYMTGPKSISHKQFLHICYVGCLTVMYKKSLFPDLQIPNDIKKRNDYALWLRISEKSKCFLLNEKLAFYRKGSPNSLSSGRKFRLFPYHMQLFQKLYSYSKFKSFFLALNNVYFYFYKKILYERKDRK